MPIVLIREISKGPIIALWKITESPQILLSRVRLTDREIVVLSGIKSMERRRQWLAARALLREIVKKQSGKGFINEVPEIIYAQDGKPSLSGSEMGLSLSHSGQYVAIAMHPTGNPGIDVECIHPRLKKIAPRFLHQKEEAYLKEETLLQQLCVIWCSKEALYKLHTGSFVSFKEQLLVSPFEYCGSGEVTGSILSSGMKRLYKINYEEIGEYILVWTGGSIVHTVRAL